MYFCMRCRAFTSFCRKNSGKPLHNWSVREHSESIAREQRSLRLEDPEYRELCQRVLRRDNWQCQFCGSMTNLEIHHQQFRSHSGEDTEENLITLCHGCHCTEHYCGI